MLVMMMNNMSRKAEYITKNDHERTIMPRSPLTSPTVRASGTTWV